MQNKKRKKKFHLYFLKPFFPDKYYLLRLICSNFDFGDMN